MLAHDPGVNARMPAGGELGSAAIPFGCQFHIALVAVSVSQRAENCAPEILVQLARGAFDLSATHVRIQRAGNSRGWTRLCLEGAFRGNQRLRNLLFVEAHIEFIGIEEISISPK